ncbi:aminoglycoside phosphotransferase family protein [Cellulomonas sp. P5_C6]
MPVPEIPAILRDGVGRTPAGREWIGRLPALVERAARRWALTVGEPFTSGAASWCAPALRADGSPAVLKVSFPHDEARDEAAALRAWHGHGAPELLGADADDWALLLERVVPGTPLAVAPGSPAGRLTVACGVLRSLWASDADLTVPEMRDVCGAWAGMLEQRAARHDADPGLVGAAAGLLRTLPGPGGVLVHGDLNPGNLLHGGGDRWLAIDPKPMRGDPAYDLWPLLEQVDDPFAHADPVRVLRERVRLVEGELAVDRVAAWGLARCTESALWIWDVLGDEDAARRSLEQAAVWARMAG